MKQKSSFSFKKCAVLFTFYSCVRLHYRNERYVVSKNINQWILWNKNKSEASHDSFVSVLPLIIPVTFSPNNQRHDSLSWQKHLCGGGSTHNHSAKTWEIPMMPLNRNTCWHNLKATSELINKKTKTINKYNLKVAWQMWRNPDSIKVTYNLNFTSKLLSCCSMLLSDVKQILFICSFVDNAQFSGQFAPWKMSLSA